MKTKILIAFSIAIISSCVGDKGIIGPQGPAGAQGAKGDKGDAGQTGEFPKTQYGSFIVKLADWKTRTVTTKDDAFYTIVPVSAINKSVLDTGIINLWWQASSNQQVILPYDRNASMFIFSSFLEKGEGRIRVDIYPSVNSLIASKPTSDMTFKWLINK